MTEKESKDVMSNLVKYMPADIVAGFFEYMNGLFKGWVNNADKVAGTGEVPVGVFPLMVAVMVTIYFEELSKSTGHSATDYMATVLEGVTKRILQSDVVDVERFLKSDAVEFLVKMNRQVYRKEKLEGVIEDD